jgi:hypothetical protein
MLYKYQEIHSQNIFPMDSDSIYKIFINDAILYFKNNYVLSQYFSHLPYPMVYMSLKQVT